MNLPIRKRRADDEADEANKGGGNPIEAPMLKWLRDNSLSIALLTLFAASFVGHAWSGWVASSEQLIGRQLPPLPLAAYLTSGEFGSSLFENWESEFLQMWAYVMLTAYLFQRGSPESKDPDRSEPRDGRNDANDRPWPVRVGGLAEKVYRHSLGWALLILFMGSFVLHWINSARHAAEEASHSGAAPPTLIEHLGSPSFWFESFQNWQSEFLSTAVLIVLAIYLREKGSPESKPVEAPHSETGTG